MKIWPLSRIFLKINLEMQIKSSDAVLKNQVLAADGIHLPALSENGKLMLLPPPGGGVTSIGR